jgi:hydrogenase maturation protease
MSTPNDNVLVYGYGNPGRGDDGLGPALAAAIEALGIPEVDVDANYQLTVEDAAEIVRYSAVLFVDAAARGPAPFWFSRVDDSGVGHVGWTSHSIGPAQVVALARDLFGKKLQAYVLGVRGYAFGELDETLSVRARENLSQALAFARKALVERNFEYYVQEFGHPAVGGTAGSPTRKAYP